MKQIQKKLIEYLKNKSDVKFGYLFGSYAHNKYTDNSDLDIALFLENYSLDTQLEISFELSKILKLEVDLVILNHIKNIYLLEDILNNGILIKDNEQRIDFELIKEHDILDFKAFRKLIDAA
ncbi:type VII toxin-antitoxin system MntA family adenylyltransferase antitoxin [Arcobacter arenosus]|jgi:predicted nucleotidyltransferase|uniref:type VII toxin-antitoxin system MntA family adenylyltransferase antitoxin n=1 Tax=Arcobacter arenosus TaxID=2576037 RepID=UPI003BACD36D